MVIGFRIGPPWSVDGWRILGDGAPNEVSVRSRWGGGGLQGRMTESKDLNYTKSRLIDPKKVGKKLIELE